MNKLLMLLVSGFAVMAFVCEAQTSRHYPFEVAGEVTAEDDAPLRGAQVTLEVDGQVYEGVKALKTKQLLTNGTGGFEFIYTSHKRGVGYTITIRKEGFKPQTVSGSAPPAGYHTIRLKHGKALRRD